MVVDASGCQLPLVPLVNASISLSPGKILSASDVSLTKLDWDQGGSYVIFGKVEHRTSNKRIVRC